MKKNRNKDPIQPVSGTKVPRFAGPSTFARLPELRDVKSCDVAIVPVFHIQRSQCIVVYFHTF